MKISRSKKGEGTLIALIFVGVFIFTLSQVTNFITERAKALQKMNAVQRRVDNIHTTNSAGKESFTIPFGRLKSKKAKAHPVYMDFGN